MPSRTDSFGIVFLEAWANGLPVVAAAAGGVPEVVRHGETGLLVPFGDLDRLTGALLALLSDPARARAMGEAGRPLVERGYTWDDRFATLLDRTRQLVDRASRAARRGGLTRPTSTHANTKTATTIAIRIKRLGNRRLRE